jgi:hypothetical protein
MPDHGLHHSTPRLELLKHHHQSSSAHALPDRWHHSLNQSSQRRDSKAVIPVQPAFTGRAELVTGTDTAVALALLETTTLPLMAVVDLATAVTFTEQD